MYSRCSVTQRSCWSDSSPSWQRGRGSRFIKSFHYLKRIFFTLHDIHVFGLKIIAKKKQVPLLITWTDNICRGHWVTQQTRQIKDPEPKHSQRETRWIGPTPSEVSVLHSNSIYTFICSRVWFIDLFSALSSTEKRKAEVKNPVHLFSFKWTFWI